MSQPSGGEALRIYEKTLACVHCGLCLPACPAYEKRAAGVARPAGAGLQRPRPAGGPAARERRPGRGPLRVPRLPRLRERLSGGSGSRRHRRGSPGTARRGSGRAAPGAGAEAARAWGGGGPARGPERGDVGCSASRGASACGGSCSRSWPGWRRALRRGSGCCRTSRRASVSRRGSPRAGRRAGRWRSSSAASRRISGRENQPGGDRGARRERLGGGDSQSARAAAARSISTPACRTWRAAWRAGTWRRSRTSSRWSPPPPAAAPRCRNTVSCWMRTGRRAPSPGG